MPFFALLLEQVVTRITRHIGGWLLRTGRIDETTAFYALGMEGAQAGLDTAIALNISFLDRTIEERYTFPEDLAIARIADPQGLGGSLGVQAAIEAPTAEGERRDT